MSIEKRIQVINKLSEFLSKENNSYKTIVRSAYNHNKWFTEENILYSSEQLVLNYFEDKKLRAWLDNYNLSELTPKNIGLILSGNIPFVGVHDLLCSYLSGHNTLIKLSSKDEKLMKYIIHSLHTIDPDTKRTVQYVDRLADFDAVIATGSNNSARYFDAYFGSYPNIIRKNRNSIAILSGTESETEIKALGDDMFRYFGLGCRNVTKLYFPLDYDIKGFIDGLQSYSYIRDHHKYKNNYDYQLSIHLLNQINHFDSGFFILRENELILSPISVFNYSYYSDKDSLNKELSKKSEEIQCIIGSESNQIAFGQAQNPALNAYADGIDTMEFLISV